MHVLLTMPSCGSIIVRNSSSGDGFAATCLLGERRPANAPGADENATEVVHVTIKQTPDKRAYAAGQDAVYASVADALADISQRLHLRPFAYASSLHSVDEAASAVASSADPQYVAHVNAAFGEFRDAAGVDLSVFFWFVGNMSRADTEALLSSQAAAGVPSGAVVRCSASAPGAFAVSFYDDEELELKHVSVTLLPPEQQTATERYTR